MNYVYLLRSLSHPEKTYIGQTDNIEKRLKKHNEGGSVFTSGFRPWELVSFIAFPDKKKALALEKYLKTGSGSVDARRLING